MNIQQARKFLEISQTELATVSALPRCKIQNYEQGFIDLTESEFRIIVHALKKIRRTKIIEFETLNLDILTDNK